MFDPLLEEDPWVKEKIAEGKLEGALEEARGILVRFVQRRYPALVQLARVRARQDRQREALDALIEQLWFAADEDAARALLEAHADS